MTARVSVDPEICIGSAECVRILPEAFRIDRVRGVSTTLPEAEHADRALLAEAVRSCPMQAISVEDA
jgi:ferredoxin